MSKVQTNVCPEKLSGDLVLAGKGEDHIPAVVTFHPATGAHYKVSENELYYHVRYLNDMEACWVLSTAIKHMDYSQKGKNKKGNSDRVDDRVYQLGRLKRRKRLGQLEKWSQSAKPQPELQLDSSIVVVKNHKRKSLSECNGIKKFKEMADDSTDEFFTPPSSIDDDAASVASSATVPEEPPTSKLKSGVCAVCNANSDCLIGCGGDCHELFHLQCLGLPSDFCGSGFICDECTVALTQCFICKQSSGMLECCTVANCNKLYHISCLQQYSRIYDSTKKTLVCPRHKCACCLMTASTSKKLLYCMKCPIALHDRETCLIAGCETVANNPKYIICHKHVEPASYGKRSTTSHFNLNSCLHCGGGGLLLCCDFCSAAYHPECLSQEVAPTSNDWLCPDCRDYQNPTYGSVVWCKLGIYRWWPSQIIPSKEVPDRLLKHKSYRGTFLVEFLGSGDHSWTHHGRCLPFTMDSMDRLNYNSKRIDQQFKDGYAIAVDLYEEAREKLEEKELHKRPSRKFHYLKANKYLVPTPRSVKEAEPCHCTEEHPCDLDSICVNRATKYECSPTSCPVKDLCQNQRIQKRQYADTVAFFTKNTGWGLKATHDIKNGDFVIEYIGEVISNEMCKERIEKAQENGVTNFYMLTLEAGLVIDACAKANKARFINHSCEPNLQTQAWTVNNKTCIGLFAITNIPAGTELTFDYRLDYVGDKKVECFCGTSSCLGYLGAKRDKKDKPHSSTATATKVIKKKRKPKKKSKKGERKTFQRRTVAASLHEDICFWCGDGGELVMCDEKHCPKAYHLDCLEIEDIPKAKWSCPWHFCDECGRKSCKSCPKCPTSFCKRHGEGELLEGCDGVLYCVDHIC